MSAKATGRAATRWGLDRGHLPLAKHAGTNLGGFERCRWWLVFGISLASTLDVRGQFSTTGDFAF